MRVARAELCELGIGNNNLGGSPIAVMVYCHPLWSPSAPSVCTDFEASVSATGIDCHIASIIQAMHTCIPSGCKKFCVFPLDTNLAERGFSWGDIWFRSSRRAGCKAEKSQRCADQEYFAILHLSITIWLSAKIEKRHVLRQ